MVAIAAIDLTVALIVRVGVIFLSGATVVATMAASPKSAIGMAATAAIFLRLVT